MGFPRTRRFVLVASLLLAGCRTPDSLEDRYALPSDPSAEEEPSSYDPAAPPDLSAESSRKAPRVLLGAWGMDGRLQGDVEGAPSQHGLDVGGIPGFSFEMRFHSR